MEMENQDWASKSYSVHSLWVTIFFHSQREVVHFLRDAAGEHDTEARGVNTEIGDVMEIILENEKKCSEKMKQDPPYNKSGTDIIQWNP